MAKRTVVQEVLEDDLDGSPADRTVHFTWDGNNYEIELSKKNAAAFEKLMKPYVDVARKARGGSSRQRAASQRSTAQRGSSQRGQSSRRGNRRDLSAIREWATQNGYEISARGRIASSVVEAYEAAHS
jgi:Lsr2